MNIQICASYVVLSVVITLTTKAKKEKGTAGVPQRLALSEYPLAKPTFHTGQI